ncbi:hypothetical protein YC2023_050396 [Brassica napus]
MGRILENMMCERRIGSWKTRVVVCVTLSDGSLHQIRRRPPETLLPRRGVGMAWAAFHAVEVVSSSRFTHKRISYHAVAQSFSDQTPVLLMITNQLRKDLNSSNEYEVSLAPECLARIGTDDLARDLTSEVFTLLGNSKALVRKKSIGVVLRVFDKYFDAVKVCFKCLVENLESSDAQLLSFFLSSRLFYKNDVDAVLIIGLPNGPAAHFKLSNLVLRKDIKNHGNPTSHEPELVLNNFTTRLGNRVVRFFQSLFPQEPNLCGRRVVTFHNQRDFIFFRHHRYILDIKEDKQNGAKGKEGVAKERVKDARLELVRVSRALLMDPVLLGQIFFS